MSPDMFAGMMKKHLIVADDHGKDALGAYGNPVIKTPALDALARDGVTCTSGYITAP